MPRISELLELATRVLCDPAPLAAVPSAYLFAQTEDNQSSVLAAGSALLRGEQVAELRLPGCQEMGGYPGSAAWRQALQALQVPPGQVAELPLDTSAGLNTKVEAEALVRHARALGEGALVVVAAPFHQLRAYMTVVRVLLAEHPQLRVYSHPGQPLPWGERARHSQGSLRATRARLIGRELERIERYTASGDLIPVRQVLGYLDRRDGKTPS